MKTRLSVKNPTKSKPEAAGTKHNRNVLSNYDSKEAKKKPVNNYFQMLEEDSSSEQLSPEERARRRLLRRKENRLMRRARETEEERLVRRRLKTAYERKYRLNLPLEKKLTRCLQRRNRYREKKEKLDQSTKVRPYKYKSIPLNNCTSTLPSNLEFPEEETTAATFLRKYAVTYGTKMKKASKFDVVSNLLHAICRKHHSRCKSDQQNYHQFRIPNTNNILATIFWHKYKNFIYSEMKEPLVQS